VKKDSPARPFTDEQLEHARAAARLDISLDDALRSPALARCLEITAEVMAVDPDLVRGRNERRVPEVAQTRSVAAAPVIDVKRVAAGDRDD
jgi:hypothetical protein